MDVLGVDRNYASLSTADLLEGRDLYHWHLINKSNVVGTAIGLYYIRKTDDWPTEKRVAMTRARASKPARTFENSEVRDYSWPCILVLVNTWVQADRFGISADAELPPVCLPEGWV